jgi:hypothetical protein
MNNVFAGRVLEMEYVGSRVTCNPAPTDTDEDILVLTSEDDIYRLVEDCKVVGFKGGEVYFSASGTASSDFYSLRKGEINLIITSRKEFFDKFLLATHVCKTLNVMSKQHRITVFQAVLYGKSYRPKDGKP